jgi:hypothetical protein
MRWKSHVRFGGRAGETHSTKVEQGAPVRPLHRDRHLGGQAVCGHEAAVERGEILPPPDANVVLDMIVGPLVFRALVTGEPLDQEFAENVATLALRMLGAAGTRGPRHRMRRPPERSTHASRSS